MERNVVESLFEDEFRELCGCPAVDGVLENAIQRVQGQVRASSWTWRRTSRLIEFGAHRFGELIMHKIPELVKLNKSDARWNYEVWTGPIEASDEHLIGTPLRVLKARAVTPIGLRPKRSMKCKARHGDHQPNIRNGGSGHNETHQEEQDNDEEEEPEEVKMNIFHEEAPGETAEEVAEKHDVLFSWIGRSYMFTFLQHKMC